MNVRSSYREFPDKPVRLGLSKANYTYPKFGLEDARGSIPFSRGLMFAEGEDFARVCVVRLDGIDIKLLT